jgi:hypothetical protein
MMEPTISALVPVTACDIFSGEWNGKQLIVAAVLAQHCLKTWCYLRAVNESSVACACTSVAGHKLSVVVSSYSVVVFFDILLSSSISYVYKWIQVGQGRTLSWLLPIHCLLCAMRHHWKGVFLIWTRLPWFVIWYSWTYSTWWAKRTDLVLFLDRLYHLHTSVLKDCLLACSTVQWSIWFPWSVAIPILLP